MDNRPPPDLPNPSQIYEWYPNAKPEGATTNGFAELINQARGRYKPEDLCIMPYLPRTVIHDNYLGSPLPGPDPQLLQSRVIFCIPYGEWAFSLRLGNGREHDQREVRVNCHSLLEIGAELYSVFNRPGWGNRMIDNKSLKKGGDGHSHSGYKLHALSTNMGDPYWWVMYGLEDKHQCPGSDQHVGVTNPTDG